MGSALAPTALALTATAQASLPAGWSASLGFNLSKAATGSLVMIGGEDPDDPAETTLGNAQQDWAYVGGVDRNEEGVITCSARSWRGDCDLVACVNDVKTALDAFAAALAANPTQGVPQLLWAEFATQIDWFQGFDDSFGVKVRAVFQIHFRALI